MINKSFVKEGGKAIARVTFIIPSGIWVDKVYLVGEFNNWNQTSHPFRYDREGRWVITVDLELGRVYEFRYLFDDDSWTNDDHADGYIRNPHGSDNFVVNTDPDFR